MRDSDLTWDLPLKAEQVSFSFLIIAGSALKAQRGSMT